MVLKSYRLLLTMGAAFSLGFLATRLRETATVGERENAASSQEALSAKDLKKSATIAAAFAEHQDVLMVRAGMEPDLIAAVKLIIEKRAEDGACDTRLFCLVESLPESRMAELPALLHHYRTDENVLGPLMEAWAERNSATAMAWMEAHPSAGPREVRAFLLGWSRADPQAALAWVESRPVSLAAFQQETALIEGMSEKDPAGAFRLLEEKGWLARNPTGISKLLRNWGAVDGEGALAGLRSVANETGLGESGIPLEGQTRAGADAETERKASLNDLFSCLLKGVFETEPARAAALLSHLTPFEKETAQEAILSEVIARDPPEVRFEGGSPHEGWIQGLKTLLEGRRNEAARSREPSPDDPFAPSPPDSSNQPSTPTPCEDPIFSK